MYYHVNFQEEAKTREKLQEVEEDHSTVNTELKQTLELLQNEKSEQESRVC